MKGNLSVGDLIKTKYLKNICRVAAGRKGLDRPVTWVHILEIRDVVKESVDGNELILTTGICFTDKETAVRFLRELIERDVAGLCIETALYYHELDQELLDLADEKNFPLIEITEISRFKDISKGLNRIIMEGELLSYESAASYNNELTEIESKGTIEDGIRYTANYLNLEIAYLPSVGKHFATSEEIQNDSGALVDSVVQNILSDEIYCRGKVAAQSLNIGNKNYGTLLFKNNHKDITDFDLLILRRLANRIKRDIMDELQNNEENLYKENSWIGQWLLGKLPAAEVSGRLKKLGAYDTCGEYGVCSFQVNSKIHFSDFITDMALFVRKLFEEQSMFVLGYLSEDKIHYIILNNNKGETLSSRFTCIVSQLQGIKKTLVDYKNTVFSLGRVVKSSEELYKSYNTSLEIMKSNLAKDKKLIVFDELYFERILFQIADMPIVEDFMENYLGQLLLPENEELLQTLIVYFECNCSKQKTAERLYIVRQTLYFRLQKLEEMLGETFSEGEHKYALEFACKAYMHRKKYARTECTEYSK